MLAILLISAVSGGIYLGWLQLSGNFHEILPGELYRSAQPTPSRIERYVAQYGIRSIINLRGANLKAEWYKGEMKASQRLGLRHVDFGLSAKKMPSSEQAHELVKLMKSLPKPILVHCKGGSDRSALASALYLAAVAGRGEEDAEGQISFRYGHIGIPFFSATFAMDVGWEKYESWLGFGDS